MVRSYYGIRKGVARGIGVWYGAHMDHSHDANNSEPRWMRLLRNCDAAQGAEGGTVAGLIEQGENSIRREGSDLGSNSQIRRGAEGEAVAGPTASATLHPAPRRTRGI